MNVPSAAITASTSNLTMTRARRRMRYALAVARSLAITTQRRRTPSCVRDGSPKAVLGIVV
jgi:hypothetical protein